MYNYRHVCEIYQTESQKRVKTSRIESEERLNKCKENIKESKVTLKMLNLDKNYFKKYKKCIYIIK